MAGALTARVQDVYDCAENHTILYQEIAMIFDSIANAESYYGLHPRFKRAFEWLKTTKVSELETGKLDIEGKDIWVNIARIDTKLPADGKWESHKVYADIQCIIEGEDRMQWARLDHVKLGDYDAAKDFQALSTEVELDFVVHAGEFAIFLPQDAHKPGLAKTAPSKVFKLVLKVRVDDIF